MVILHDYDQFAGVHWETGSVRNALAHQGFRAPHTGKPYSEALLLGISGGIAFGYFTFHYEGYAPQCNILTRNTFDPLERMLSRLGVVQNRAETRSEKRAVANLLDPLADGVPAIVWADMWSLPYNALAYDEGMWATYPIVVYGYDPEEDLAYIADRARVPLRVTTGELATARGRVKKDRYRLLAPEAPDPQRLAAAVTAGIWDTIRLFTEKPPKGSRNSFGLTALRFWAQMLTQSGKRKSWQKEFPPGLAMYEGLKSAYNFAFLFGKGTAEYAERGRYARFLEEAALLLDRPALGEAARRFRASAGVWHQLASLLLAEDVPPFAETRTLLRRRHRLFLEEGQGALHQMQEIDRRLDVLSQTMAGDFPLAAEGEVAAYRERLADHLLALAEQEEAAVAALRTAMA